MLTITFNISISISDNKHQPMNTSTTIHTSTTANPVPISAAAQGVAITNITEQFKGLSLQNQQYQTVPSQVTGNKENSKKTTDTANGQKVALKPREFGREITNATAATSNTGA